ncbi:MAG: signal peptidase II [Phycisphaerae bacterium]|nr:signal peptidase II [Phycisphaerae bacterium]
MGPDASPTDEPARRSDASEPARRHVRPWAIFLALTAAGTAADLWTKHHLFEALLSRPDSADRIKRVHAAFHAQGTAAAPQDVLHAAGVERPLFAGIRLTLQTNPGVVFGLRLPGAVVAVATTAAVALVGWFFLTSPAWAWELHAAMGCILGGALGNAYDRLWATVTLPGGAGVIRHQVRDFVNCAAWGYPWVFNIADALLVIGVVLLVAHSLLAGRRGRRAGAA